MKRRFLTCLLLALAAQLSVHADDEWALNLNLADGRKMQFLLDSRPEVTCHNGTMTVWQTTAAPDENGEMPHVQFSRDEVASLTLEQVTSSIAPIAEGDDRVRFRLTRAGVVQVSGLQGGDRLRVFTLDGRAVQAPVSQAGGQAVIDLGAEPRGCYVVSVNQRFTFKLMKP